VYIYEVGIRQLFVSVRKNTPRRFHYRSGACCLSAAVPCDQRTTSYLPWRFNAADAGYHQRVMMYCNRP